MQALYSGFDSARLLRSEAGGRWGAGPILTVVRTAIGVHAGGETVVVAVSGGVLPEVVGRWSLCLVDHRSRPELAQPYHAAAEVLGIEAGRERIRLCQKAAREAADGIVDTVLSDLSRDRHRPTLAGLVTGAGRLAGSLEEILRSHVQLHTAEGELLRTALREAAEARDLEVVGVGDRGLGARVAAVAQLSELELTRRIDALGKSIGPPWTKREKSACLVAWAALAEAGGGNRTR